MTGVQTCALPICLLGLFLGFFLGYVSQFFLFGFLGFSGEFRYGLLNDVRKLDKERYPLMIERFMALAYEPGADLPQPYPRPALQIDPQSRAAALAKFGLTLDRPVLALCPGRVRRVQALAVGALRQSGRRENPRGLASLAIWLEKRSQIGRAHV